MSTTEITLEELFEKPVDPKILDAAKRLLEQNGFIVADVRGFREPRLEDAPFEFPDAPTGELRQPPPRWQILAVPVIVAAGFGITVYLQFFA